ncbi:MULTISPECIES: hypothetical protein [Stenotrophomonas]|nr:hypothetical protein [Stenotrophomonas maltophilia]
MIVSKSNANSQRVHQGGYPMEAGRNGVPATGTDRTVKNRKDIMS